jgi:hypothetical protein
MFGGIRGLWVCGQIGVVSGSQKESSAMGERDEDVEEEMIGGNRIHAGGQISPKTVAYATS